MKATAKPKAARLSFSSCPRHVFLIPALSFEAELNERQLGENWFKLGEWSHGYETDRNRLQRTLMRQSLLIPKAAFPKVFDQLESVGNVLHSMGKAGGSLSSSGGVKRYRYEPFHHFNLQGIEADAEPLVFIRESTASKYLFLNPDVVIQQDLVEKVTGTGIWWDPRTSTEVIRHQMSADGIESIQMHHAYLRRYLQARQMTLLVGHYCHRHLYNPTQDEIALFEEGEITLGSPRERAKAVVQNWGLRKDVGDSFLQRRLHLWFAIAPPSIDLDDPWADEPPFNPHTFTLPTRNGPVAPARWAHFRGRGDYQRFKGKTCDFMDIIYFRQEALIRYETSSDFVVTDSGDVLCGSHWGLSRSTFRLGNDLLCTAIGDWAEGVPFSEWKHWQMYAVEPPSYESIETLRNDKPISDVVNELYNSLQGLNSAFAGLASALGRTEKDALWSGAIDGLPARQMKWVYPANANEDEFLKRATLASTFVSDELQPKVMRELLLKIDPSLHLNKENKLLGSRNLLQRIALVASIIASLRPKIGDVASIVAQAESPSSQALEKDLRLELAILHDTVRSDFAPIAFLYDLRVHGGIAHPPNKNEAKTAAVKLGLRPSHWSRNDFISTLTMVTSSLHRLTTRMNDATSILWNNPSIQYTEVEHLS